MSDTQEKTADKVWEVAEKSLPPDNVFVIARSANNSHHRISIGGRELTRAQVEHVLWACQLTIASMDAEANQ